MIRQSLQLCILFTWMSQTDGHIHQVTHAALLPSPPVRLSWDKFFFIFQSLLPVHYIRNIGQHSKECMWPPAGTFLYGI